MEPVYRGIEIAAAAAASVLGTKITYLGLENIPADGGAVVAMNHVSYIDYLAAGLASRQRRRRIRYMLKAEALEHGAVDWIIKHTDCIPVDRSAGAGAYAEAVRRLRIGQLVGVFPEATISRSFELKEFKTGAVRMALEAQVPIVPLVIWGPQRMWTKDHPKNLGRQKIPWTVRAGPPLPPQGTMTELDAALRAEMTEILHEVQEHYPHPEGAFWVPKRIGGSAPSPEEARRLDEAERAGRARRATEPT
ncbi:lysophospholipid acyltransferase family protein [Mycolicibacterium sp.]|uniref:lysophospholipid acyltransferase family protein n=1 Tax=Mycolicibacterium sp. TaxID=2320850 RepID=UPI0028A8F613|nr:lysophospholipid acyltransferase family protein [Mycolicibacterium sp.]